MTQEPDRATSGGNGAAVQGSDRSPMGTERASKGRLGARQAERLFQLSCGYMICRSDPDPYKALRAKGYVEDSTRKWRGDIEYETGESRPRVTLEGMAALRAYVDRNGPLEIEITPLMAHYKQVLRMEPGGPQ